MNAFKFSVIFIFCALAGLSAQDKPNIIWMVSEDNGARWLGCYGNPAKPTPNLDKFASEGFRYTNTYASVPVCAPQRFTWFTGMNAISVGTQGMRSSVTIPDFIQFYPDIFKKLGYYTSKGDDAKTDYNYRGRSGNDAWDDPKKINWDNLKENQPFLHVFNTHDTHEWQSFGGFKLEKDKSPKPQNLAAYHPDTPEMRFIYEKYNNAHRKMDERVAGWLKDLEESGMAENTIVIYSSDHGGVLPRSKRYLYNSGTHCPLIIRIPEKFKHLYPAAKPGSTVDELVSFLDFPKTWLSLAGATAEDVKQMQGRVFLGKKKDAEPQYVYSFRNRMDDRFDMVRSARDHKFLYIRNYMPFVPVGQYLPYCYNSVSTRSWRRHHLAGKTNEITGRFFKQPRAVDELYLYNEDYDNVKNLAINLDKAAQMKKMRTALRKWQLEIFDTGFLPEDEIGREAQKHELTVYEFARKPELYPLAKYIDIADLSVELNPKNSQVFLQSLNDKYLGIRYWSTLGLLNLSFANKLAATSEVVGAMQKLLKNEESEVIKSYAAWILIRCGQQEQGLAYIRKQSSKTYTPRAILNVLDWMDPKIALPLVTELYMRGEFKSSDQTKIAVKLIIENGSPELAKLVEEKAKLGNQVKAKQGRLKKLKKSKLTAEKLETEKKKAQFELEQVLGKIEALNSKILAIAPQS